MKWPPLLPGSLSLWERVGVRAAGHPYRIHPFMGN